MEKRFLPIKILDKEYAETLYKHGEIFMRSLHEFGSWGVFDQEDSLKNDYRADLYSGVTTVFKSPEDSEIFRETPEELKAHMKYCCYIDGSSVQYFKIYSMYCWDYDNTGFFKPIDSRMGQFGDTAVIITDFQEFLRRVGNKLIDLYDPVSVMCDRVEFFDFSQTRELNPIFFKHFGQSYQNELRIAACSLKEGDSYFRGLKKDYEPIKFEIGPITDISIMLPTRELIEGTVDIPINDIVWPSSEDKEKPSNYDKVVDFTRFQMSLFKPQNEVPMFSI